MIEEENKYNKENKLGIKSFTFDELQEYLVLMGEKKYRAEQIFRMDL